MIFPDAVRIIFISFTGVFVGLLIAMSVFMYRQKNPYRFYILLAILIGIFSSVAYSLFLCAEDHELAVLFDSIFFVGTDWLVVFMFQFVIEYTEIFKKFKQRFLIIFAFLALIDTASLLVNNYTNHMFNLILLENEIVGLYWGNQFYALHYVHLLFCYIVASLTFVCLFISMKKCPNMYKTKYSGIFGAYLVVLLTNMICYTINLPFDLSVILYVVLAGFICYYSTFAFPHSLLIKTLISINETIDDGVLYFDELGECLYANKIAKIIFSENEVYNRVLAEEFCISLLKQKNDENQGNHKLENFMVGDKLRRFRVEVSKEINNGEEVGTFVKLIDVTLMQNAMERDHYVAIHDELTGLLNRTGYLEAVDAYIAKHGCEDMIMLTSNIKDFKLINAMFGESAGDEVLLRQSQIIAQNMHPGTISGRTGDDKFSIFTQKKYGSEKQFEKYINHFRKVSEEIVFQLHCYCGMYSPEGNEQSALAMYDKTLMALDAVSGSYSQIFSHYDSSIMDRILDEKNICEDFISAIGNGQIQMYLQPIIDEEKNTIGAEALCRWNHPTRGLLDAQSFLPILEKESLIYQLDEFMWNEAAKKLREWKEKGISNCYISVNVAVKDFYYADIYRYFCDLVKKYDIEPSSLHIEITENIFMSNMAKSLVLSNKLQNEGFVVIIDNFGNGYSSLNMLKNVESISVKIDQEFLASAYSHERGKIILDSIVKMTKILGIECVCEGVENREQYEILKSVGCTSFQGNYFVSPLTVDVFETQYLKRNQNS